jgi:2-haloacid dehalogenase/putative hydrolase of the HAD superfamily
VKAFQPQAILLDFYGTVVEEDDAYITKVCQQIAATSPLAVTTAEVASYWGREFLRSCAESFGSTFCCQKELEDISLRRVLQHFEVDLDSRELSQTIIEYWAKPAVFPETKAVLAECDLPICLVSNIDTDELHLALKYNDLSFERIVTSEACRAYKPRPEMFEKALSLLGLSPKQVLHVGDSYGSDVRGAKALGIPVLWLNRKNRQAPQADGAPDYVSVDLTGLLNILKK